jgi:hypothetical protein
MRLVIRLGILALILGGGYLFRDRLTSSASDLVVGDCFDVPVSSTDVKDVQHHPCTESHTGEVFAVLTNTAAKGTPPLSHDALISYLATSCGPLWISYVGQAAATGGQIDAGAFYPPDDRWNKGDRSITCYSYRVDGKPMTTSMKKTP